MKPFDEREYAGLHWNEMSWDELRSCAKQGRIALLPLGSIEQHGPMLPVGCDQFLAHTWALEAARRARDDHGVLAVVLPTVPYGVSTNHMDFPGTVSLGLETYLRLLQDIVREVVRAGFRKIVCVSGHGGNIAPAREILRDLGAKLKAEKVPQVRLYMADDRNCFAGANEVYAKIEQGQFNFHADAVETSYYLALRPDLVKRKGLVKPKVKCRQMPLHANWYTKGDITDSGASGNPALGNAEYGKELFQYFPRALAAFLKKVSVE
jgi:creatinine amidohydrolase